MGNDKDKKAYETFDEWAKEHLAFPEDWIREIMSDKEEEPETEEEPVEDLNGLDGIGLLEIERQKRKTVTISLGEMADVGARVMSSLYVAAPFYRRGSIDTVGLQDEMERLARFMAALLHEIYDDVEVEGEELE